MTDKLTNAEIVKALECHNNMRYDNNACDECPFLNHCDCSCKMSENALDLINRLQAENEALINGQETLQKYIAEQKSENERLKEEKSKLENKIDEIYPLVMQLPNAMEQAKAEAYKEFAELLHCQCENIINQPHNENVRPISWKVAYEEFDKKIDNLLKKLVGEDK